MWQQRSTPYPQETKRALSSSRHHTGDVPNKKRAEKQVRHQELLPGSFGAIQPLQEQRVNDKDNDKEDNEEDDSTGKRREKGKDERIGEDDDV